MSSSSSFHIFLKKKFLLWFLSSYKETKYLLTSLVLSSYTVVLLASASLNLVSFHIFDMPLKELYWRLVYFFLIDFALHDIVVAAEWGFRRTLRFSPSRQIFGSLYGMIHRPQSIYSLVPSPQSPSQSTINTPLKAHFNDSNKVKSNYIEFIKVKWT